MGVRNKVFGISMYYSTSKYCYVAENLAFAGLKKEKCPNCGCLKTKELIFQGDDALLIDGAKKYPDFMLYGSVGLAFIISERAVEAFEREKITGYDTAKKVPLYRSRYKELIKQEKEYYMLNITGTVDLDLNAMTLKKKNICSVCGNYKWNRQRLGIIDSVFDMSTWNGEDLCRIKSFPGHIVVSDRLKSAVEQHNLSGITFKPENAIFRV